MLYWEDLKIGDSISTMERTLERNEIIDFAQRYDPQPFHVDEDAARLSIYGGLIASGWHVAAIVMRLMVDSSNAASLGSPGLEDLRWLKPVRPGDTLRARRTILETRPSESNPRIGIVKALWEVFNQESALVMMVTGYSMVQRRRMNGA
jgi:acyl dehydratase